MGNEYIDLPSGNLPYATKQEVIFMDLLNEYLAKYYAEHGNKNLYMELEWWSIFNVHETIIISNRFGFIKHLVGGKNIDREKLQNILVNTGYDFPIWKSYDQLGSEDIENYTRYESLVMLLSIQNNPIEFLTNIIK